MNTRHTSKTTPAAAELDAEPGLEPERYELYEAPRWRFDLDRRDFFRLVGGGIVVALVLQEAPAMQRPGRRGISMPTNQALAAWLHIDDAGKITVYTGKVEVGQNIRTSLSQAVAEELRVPVESIALVMADTDRVPFDSGTSGSRTTPGMAPQLRRVGATTRELLLDLAAEQLQVARDTLVIAECRVTHPASNRSLGFGELAKDQKLAKTVTASTPLTPPDAWKVGGTSMPKVDARVMVTGQHEYASDIHRPEMLFGRVLRPDQYGGKLVTVDTKAAEAMEGVTVVHDGEFVGVVAKNQRLADRAIGAIEAEWKAETVVSDRDLFEQLKRGGGDGAGRSSGRGSFNSGSIEAGLAEAAHRVEATYTIAYIAHAPLEPRAAVAEWVDGKLTVWTGTQRPFGVRGDLAGAFGLKAEQVRVIVPDTGSGYGGKHTGEAAIEAARLAKAAGKPVKLVWTREEEFSEAYFRPAGVIDIKAAATSDGKITAWEFHNYNSGSSAIRPLYDIANQRVQFHNAQAPLRQGSYRALAATANHFARESTVDTLAHAVGRDPLDFRLASTSDERLRAVLAAAAKEFGWSSAKAADGRGIGIAGGNDKDSYVATCAEVAVDPASGEIKVIRLVTAFECGAIVNPEHLKNQIEGAAVMGLGGALFEVIEFDEGRITNGKFSRYRVPRFSDLPALSTVLLDRKDLPSVGAGETPIVCIAPAIGNAVFHASGVRLTSLPMRSAKKA